MSSLADRWIEAAAVAGEMSTHTLRTRSKGTSRSNREPTSMTTQDKCHGRNYVPVVNGDV